VHTAVKCLCDFEEEEVCVIKMASPCHNHTEIDYRLCIGVAEACRVRGAEGVSRASPSSCMSSDGCKCMQKVWHEDHFVTEDKLRTSDHGLDAVGDLFLS